MSPRSAIACTLLLFFSAGPAAAGPIPWSYRNPTNEMLLVPDATGGFSFPNRSFTPASGDADIVATPLYSWSVAPATAPDRVTNLPYRFAFEIEDGLSGESASLSFEGTLSGTFWLTGSELDNRFVGPTARSVELGGNTYTLSLVGFDAPDGYGEEFGGGITARMSFGGVTPPPPGPDPTPPPDPVGTPEPSTVLLAILGLPAAAVVRRARRRTR